MRSKKVAGEKSGGTFQTLRWKNDHLELIDQRILPSRIAYVRVDSAVAVADAIRSMVVRGAPAIGCTAAYGVAIEAIRQSDQTQDIFEDRLKQAFEIIANSRPTAVNLFWALSRMRAAWGVHRGSPSRGIAAALLEEAHTICADDVRINRAMGEHGAQLLKDGDRVLTHCNAGALATAGHGTALGVIRSAVENGKQISVIAGETRPFLQGARLTAWEMMQEKIPVTLITDSMVGFMMKNGEIDAVIVGADRVAANGDVANKIGTYGIAVLAHRHGIPFYVACPLSTIDLGTINGSAIPIEERPISEVTGYGGHRWAVEDVSVRNPAFDVTPAELVSALVTEKGVVRYPSDESIGRLFEAH